MERRIKFLYFLLNVLFVILARPRWSFPVFFSLFFISSSFAATDTNLFGDDHAAGPFPIGFEFSMQGRTYTNFYASTNGLLQFENASNAYTNSCLPSMNSTIYAFWDDLRTDSPNQISGKIEYLTVGEAPNRKLIVQWTNQYFFGSNLPMGTFQVVLYEGSNEVKIQYRNLLDSRSMGGSATIGVQGVNGARAELGCNKTEAVQPESAVSFKYSNGEGYVIDKSAPYDFMDISGYTVVTPAREHLYANESASWNWGKVTGLNNYEVEVLSDTGASLQKTVVGDVGAFSWSEGQSGKAYRLRVRGSINNGGTWEAWSNPSEPVLFDKELPVANLISIEQVSFSSVRVSYEASDGVSGIESAVLMVSDSENPQDIISVNLSGSDGVVELNPSFNGRLLSYKIKAVDKAHNSSLSDSRSFVLVRNPSSLRSMANVNAFELSWDSSSPSLYVKKYDVYVSEAYFDNVSSMQLRLSIPVAGLAASITGLKVGATYYAAVVAKNINGGYDPAVTPIEVRLLPDTQGPDLKSLVWRNGSSSLDITAQNQTLATGEFQLQAEDLSGVASVDVQVDGAVLPALRKDGAVYRFAFDAEKVADGDHQVLVRLTDTLDNVSESTYPFTVSLPPPAAPTLRLKSGVRQTNEAMQRVLVQGAVGTTAGISLNGARVGEVLLDTSGTAELPVTLQQGENSLTAQLRYSSRTRFGAASSAVQVLLDTSIPDAPTGLQVATLSGGVIQAQWGSVGTVAGYHLYYATQPFSSVGDTGVARLNGALLKSTGYQHRPTADGLYYYRVSSVNALGSESALSTQQSARLDRTGPQVTRVTYSSSGQVSADGRYGSGQVQVQLAMNEELRNAPFFSLDMPDGLSIPVRMTKAANDPLFYQGSFDLTSAMPAGTLYARVSAYDLVGNEGTEILDGKTLKVDTQGPEIQQLTLQPTHPIRNVAQAGAGVSVQVAMRLNEAVVATPQLSVNVDGAPSTPIPGPLALVADATAAANAPVYRGSFTLPADLGAKKIQLLSFSYQATDVLGNVGQVIQGRNQFQVYTGDLPPLDIPQGLTGKALARGRAEINWRAVAEADTYAVYRRAEGESAFTRVGRTTELRYLDDLAAAGLADGAYYYQVASIRKHEGEEALSLPSDPVKVEVVGRAPKTPSGLQAELTGSGIALSWQAPDSATVKTYRLYRAAVAQGESLEIASLTALQTDLAQTATVDAHPSSQEHSYAVTAVDAIGNESAPSASVYLNAKLLPVRNLIIQATDDAVPLLHWEHEGTGIAGYNVYAQESGAAQKLNRSLLSQPSYRDVSVAVPFAGERQYRVTAVDTQGVESLPSELLLPAVQVQVLPTPPLERGVFSELRVRVNNTGAHELKRLRLALGLETQGQTKQHYSSFFDVAPGASSEVAVVVGGYQDLTGSTSVKLRVLYAPQAGQEAQRVRQQSLAVGTNGLLAELVPDEFIAGARGNVRLRLTNPTAVPTELVTALGNGAQASDEVRLILEDLQGNILTSEPLKAFTGTGLVTGRDGRTVARVGGLETVDAGPFSLLVPEGAPERVRLRLEASALHYHTGLADELQIAGVLSSRELTLAKTPYYGELTRVTPAEVQAGETVTLRGRALARDTQKPLTGVELKLILATRGFEQAVSVTTDSQGAFEYRHATATTDSGNYQVSVIHPNLDARPQSGRFSIKGASVSPALVKLSFPKNYEQAVDIVVAAGHDTSLQNVRLEYVQPSTTTGLPTGIRVSQSAPLNLSSQQHGTLTLRISGDNTAAASSLLDYRIVADDLAQPLGQTRIQYSLGEASPVVRMQPSQLRTGAVRGSEQVENLTLSNTGLEVLRNARISLLNEQGSLAPSWVSLRTPDWIASLPVGASSLLSVAFAPAESLAEGDYYFTLRVQSENHPVVDIPLSIAVNQSGKGGVIFQVEDIYTGTLDKQGQRILGLQGARIKLQNRKVLSAEFTASTDEKGQALLKDLPAGEYSYRLSAWDHEDLTGQLWIKPGLTQDERVFLKSKLVTVEWSVKEISLQDRYDILLNATFKTNVPTALVMIEPLSINLPPMRRGDVFQGELTLTNYGLIRADNVTAKLPTGDARARIEYLREVPKTLASGDVVVIPYRIVALQSFDPDDQLNGAAGCWSFSFWGSVLYDSICTNGMVIAGQASLVWNSSGNTSSCGSGGGGASGGGAWGGWGGGGWGGGSLISRPTPLSSAKHCPPPPDCEAGCFGPNGSVRML